MDRDYEIQQHEALSRAQHARELLDNPVFQGAMAAIEEELIDQWANCPARDKDGKEALWQLYKMSQKFQNLLKGYLETGKLAATNLASYEQSKLDKVRQFFKRA